MKDVVIINGARTPFGGFGGSLKGISAIKLGVLAAQAAISRSDLIPGQIDNVVFGNVLHTCRDAHIFARHVGLGAEVPIEASALTVNRICGTGLEAILTAARFLLTGESRIVLAGGSENMSESPHIVRGARWGTPLGGGEFEDTLSLGLRDGYIDMAMGETAEKLAHKYNITREQQDEYALRSHLRAAAHQSKALTEEIVPVMFNERKKQTLEYDEKVRPDANMSSLSVLKPAFEANGTVTAGNSSSISDGAAAVTVTTADVAKELGIRPLGRVLNWCTVGLEPTIMGLGPVFAIRKLLSQANLKLEDIDLFEINEAFAAQYLAVETELKLNREKVNVNGGAIAIGHPLAASGARITLSVLDELKRRGRPLGIVSSCIGGGQGIAALVECLQI